MKRWLFYTLIVLFSAVFLVSGFFLVRYLAESVKSAKTYDTLALLVQQARQETAPAVPDAVGQEEAPTQPDPLTQVLSNDGRTVQVLREYAPIYELNNDFVGWLRIPGTKVNYPVVQHPEEKDYYLKRDFYGNASNHGAIYVKEDCDVEKPSDNVTVYGHRMKDGSMFASLHLYLEKAFWEEHPYIYMDSLQEHRTYEIMAVFTMSASDPDGFMYHEFVEAEDPVAFDRFTAQCKALSLYDTGVDAQWGDSFITLSTCEYSRENGRLVIIAKRID